jgi:hypothetical protein
MGQIARIQFGCAQDAAQRDKAVIHACVGITFHGGEHRTKDRGASISFGNVKAL